MKTSKSFILSWLLMPLLILLTTCESRDIDADHMLDNVSLKSMTLLNSKLDKDQVFIFGPEVFMRSTAEPQVITKTIRIENYGLFKETFRIILQNGDDEGSHCVSSAVIKINDEEIIGTSIFNNKPWVLEKEIILPESFDIQVVLKGKPGDLFTLGIAGTLNEEQVLGSVYNDLVNGGFSVEESIEQFTQNIQETKEKVAIETNSLYNELEDSTLITIRVTPIAGPIENLCMMSYIPKQIASTVDEINFLTPPNDIINQDPLIMWEFGEVTLPIEISFKVVGYFLKGLVNIVANKLSFLEPQYYGAEVMSSESYLYGRFVVRMKPVRMNGVINSFFTYFPNGEDEDGNENDTRQEIDIEAYGNKDVRLTYHYPGEIHELPKNPYVGEMTTEEEFKIYGIDWTPNYLKWWVEENDGTVRQVHKIPNSNEPNQVASLTQEQYIMLNIWTHHNPFEAGELDPDNLPVKIVYDWVKYYSYNKSTGEFSDEDELDENFDNTSTNIWIPSNYSSPSKITEFSESRVQLDTDNGYLILYLTNMDQQVPDLPPPLDIITDIRDGNEYKTIKIGDQTWMAENLAYLPEVTSSSEPSTTDPLYYVSDYQGNDVNNAKETDGYQTYGVLYNWPAAVNACPTGWHLPSDAEWMTLEMHLGMSQEQAYSIWWRGTDEGGKLKENGTVHWQSPNIGATNESGFTALPWSQTSNQDGIWWSATEYREIGAYYRSLHYLSSRVFKNTNNKGAAMNVRCIED